MRGNRPSGMFVTGVDTEVGKTFAAAAVARHFVSRGIRVGVCKPVASGCRRTPGGRLVSSDAETLWRAANRPAPLDRVCPLRYAAPVAPPTAAAQLGERIELDSLLASIEWWKNRCDFLIVEGAGGWLSPLGHEFDNRDLAAALGLPLLVVAANRLGVINHARLTIESVRSSPATRSLDIIALVLSETQPNSRNDPSQETNATDLDAWMQRTLTPAPPLVRLPYAAETLVLPS